MRIRNRLSDTADYDITRDELGGDPVLPQTVDRFLPFVIMRSAPTAAAPPDLVHINDRHAGTAALRGSRPIACPDNGLNMFSSIRLVIDPLQSGRVRDTERHHRGDRCEERPLGPRSTDATHQVAAVRAAPRYVVRVFAAEWRRT